MEIYGLSESIECNAAYIVAKKIIPSPPLNHELFGKCIKYVCTRDGEAEIKKELNPKLSLCENPKSYLNIGDKLKCNSFYVLAKGFKAIRLEKVHFSGAHNSREFVTNDFTFAEITKPYSVGMKITIELPENYISPIKKLTK